MSLTYNVLQKGRITTQVKNALSHTYDDQDEYDATNYRNELDASYLGRAWVMDTDTTAGDIAQSSQMQGVPPWDGNVSTAQDAESMDDRLNAEEPRNELKKRTKLIIWSGAGGTGDILFEGWADQIISFSTGVYQTL